MAPDRAESPQDRTGKGVGDALHRAFPATNGEAIGEAYPPDAACDERFCALVDRLGQVTKRGKPNGRATRT